MIISVIDRVEYLLEIGLVNSVSNNAWFILPQTSPCFLHLCSTSLLKTLGKVYCARNEQFLLSHRVSYAFGELYTIFIKLKIVDCKAF